MESIIKLGVAWLFLVYYFLYLQTNYYGYLAVSLGAGANLCAYMFLDQPQLAKIFSIAGSILFWGGIAIIATFGMSFEKERLHLSSWSQILRGIVPQSLSKVQLSKRRQLAHGLMFLLSFTAIFSVAGDLFMSLNFVVLMIVYVFFYFRVD